MTKRLAFHQEVFQMTFCLFCEDNNYFETMHSSYNTNHNFLSYKVVTNIDVPTSHGSPHLQTQIQAVLVLFYLHSSLISFSHVTFPGVSYRIFLLCLPCHFYLVDIEQQHPTGFSFCSFPGFPAILTLLPPNNNDVF